MHFVENSHVFCYDNTDLVIGGIRVDQITKKFLGEFCNSYEIDGKEEDKAFEHFCNFCCVNRENGIVDIKLEEFSTGKMRKESMVLGLLLIINWLRRYQRLSFRYKILECWM